MIELRVFPLAFSTGFITASARVPRAGIPGNKRPTMAAFDDAFEQLRDAGAGVIGYDWAYYRQGIKNGRNWLYYWLMLRTDTLQITPEILNLIAGGLFCIRLAGMRA